MYSPLTEKYLRPSEVAAIVRKDPTTIRRWIKRGLLPAVRLPGHPDKANYLIRRQDVERLLEIPYESAHDDVEFEEVAGIGPASVSDSRDLAAAEAAGGSDG